MLAPAHREALRRTKLTKSRVLRPLALETLGVFIVIAAFGRGDWRQAALVTAIFAALIFLVWAGFLWHDLHYLSKVADTEPNP